MSTSKAFQAIVTGLNEAIAHRKGHRMGAKVHDVTAEEIDVKALRSRLGMTQAAFAEAFEFRLGTVQQWEQKRRSPRGPERTLLRVIEREPEAVRRALSRGDCSLQLANERAP